MAALHVARGGADVTVLEHADRIGGAATSVECTLPGFVHDSCAAFLPMAAVSPAMRELGLDVDWVNPDTVLAHPFDDGTAIALHRDVDRTVESLGAAGPGWARAMQQLLPHASAIAEAVLGRLPPVRAGTRVALGLNRDLVEWARRLLGSAEALGLDLFDGDRRATAWLSGSAQHSGLPPTAALSGAFGMLLQLTGHSHGWLLPRGGVQALTDALVREATAAGATLRTGASVERIRLRGGRVVGVQLRGGEEVAGDAIISTVSATVLARMLPEGALPGRLERRLKVWRAGTAPFKLDYALAGPMPWTAAEPRTSGVVHLAGPLEDLVRAADTARRGEVPERPALVVGQQSLHDPTRAPAGRHTLYVYGHVPARYEPSDDEVVARIEAQLDRFAPGWRSLVLARAQRSPAQTEAENPSLVGGDLAGGSYEIDQQLVFRPAPSLSRYKTPIDGLYMAGASTHPGGAVHGMSGRGAAQALLRARRVRSLLPHPA
ncbi:phytoene dehydrogenase-like protein [Solirubrobacter pauli]|uniref:Pyridine nucleotide-disulfide oxidoreductase domain-containing protein 2 n=1 Tax=Solirubrobacter pauli TaxID=166793 RepID=A0A660KZE6_9ACTN|nr:phytoene dehydrogenase-like protein [Solirubrobacter pauli]